MALDLGERRIGIAISDPTQTIAGAHSVWERKSRAEDFAHYSRLIDENRVVRLVIGLPVTLGGDEGQRAVWVRDYASDLDDQLDVPIDYWDESLTTVEAEAALRSQGKRGRKLRARVDAVAATIILQSYLDSRPATEAQPHDE